MSKKILQKYKTFIDKNKYLFAVVLFLTGTCLHTLHTVLIKFIGTNTTCSTYEILFLRGFFTFIIFTPLFLIKTIKLIVNRQVIPILITVLLLSMCSTYCWHYGMSMIPINNGVIINFLSPIATSVVACLFIKEKLSKEIVISIIICFLTIFFAYGFTSSFTLGYVLLVCDILSYSMYVVLSKKLIVQTKSPASLLYFQVMIICITSLHVLPSLTVKISADYNILLSTFLTTLFYIAEGMLILKAYTYTSVSSLQPLYYTRFIFASIFSYLLLGEMLTLQQILTAAIIVVVNLNVIRILKKR